jgi:hypothetical protein
MALGNPIEPTLNAVDIVFDRLCPRSKLDQQHVTVMAGVTRDAGHGGT